MRYSFMTFSCPDLGLRNALALARRLGYDGIEPRSAAKHAHGVEIDAPTAWRPDARRAIADSGVALACIATSLKYADTGAGGASERIEETIRYVDLARDLGCGRLRVFGGQIPAGVSREAATDAVAACLREVARRASGSGVTVCVESHDDWCTPTDLARVMELVDSPEIAVNWDIMHPVLTGGVTMDDAWRTLGRWTRHVHAHDGDKADGNIVLAPIGKGRIDHVAALGLLKSAGFDGFVSGEWIAWEPYETHLPRELAALKAIEASLRR
ncbi:MAG TPA: sugar phosphate isomerase/epimerase family protein [Desulfobacterales bacterium]|nr:sugar phosphate isomerase/epimerase family protein [Desulfobacterales bacterium]